MERDGCQGCLFSWQLVSRVLHCTFVLCFFLYYFNNMDFFLEKAMGSQCRDFTKVVGNMVSFIL